MTLGRLYRVGARGRQPKHLLSLPQMGFLLAKPCWELEGRDHKGGLGQPRWSRHGGKHRESMGRSDGDTAARWAFSLTPLLIEAPCEGVVAPWLATHVVSYPPIQGQVEAIKTRAKPRMREAESRWDTGDIVGLLFES